MCPLAWLLSACAPAHGDPPADPPACEPTATWPPCSQPAPTFAADVLPLLNRDCNTPACHGTGGPAWPLIEYQDVADWADNIEYDVEACMMPPPDAGALSASDKAQLVDWIACGSHND